MSAHGEAVTERIRSAMQSTNPRDIVTGVKDAVALEVQSLSPDAKLVFTDYYNHSYMPDLVLEWNDAGKRDERPIFLRNALQPDVVEQDVRSLAPREPVVLSLTSPTELTPRFDLLRERARQAKRVLVTDVASLADIASPTDALGSPVPYHFEGTPLLRLVQANLLKGGRGLLTGEDAERLTRSVTPPAADGVLTEQFLASFERSTGDLFAPDAAMRLRRAVELLRFGLSRQAVDTLAPTGGQLSDVELRVLLPYLLSNETANANPRLWAYVGSMMSLERLEDMWAELIDVDVSPLVVANAHRWTARRAQLVFSSSYGEYLEREVLTEMSDDGDVWATGEVIEYLDAGPDYIEDVPVPSWGVRNRMLTAEVGPWRLFVTSDARRLKGRTDSSAARWDDISPFLTGFALDAVDLRGTSRRIFVGAEESGDVSADVALIRGNIEDDFRVTEVRVRRIGDDEAATGMKVDFTEMTVTAGHAPIASLVTAAALLGRPSFPDFSALIDMRSRSLWNS
ncbi:hypothetical protein ACVCAH_35110 [Micromonospora sp. LZ34]